MTRAVVVVAALLGCSFEKRAGSSDAAVDDAAVDAAPDVAIDALVLGPWGTPTPIVLAPPSATDDDPTLTGDLLELYFNSSRGGGPDIYRATRTALGAAWSTPARVDELSSAANETTPEVSADGLLMFLASDRDTTEQDIWVSTRATRADPWGAPVRVVELSNPLNDAAGAVTPDRLAVALASYRKAGLSPDVYMSERASTADPWSAPVELVALNTDGHEGSPHLASDRLAMYFDTNRENLNMQLYVSTRASTAALFPAPTPIAELNSSAADSDPWVSPDHRHVVFVSDRGGASALWESSR